MEGGLTQCEIFWQYSSYVKQKGTSFNGFGVWMLTKILDFATRFRPFSHVSNIMGK